MADWPADGTTNWNAAMLAFLAVSFNTDGTLKNSIRGLSAYTNKDSDNNTMLKNHAFLAATDGQVYVHIVNQNNKVLRGFVGNTNDPAGAGDLIQRSSNVSGSNTTSITFEVAKGEYFEVTYDGSNTATIQWKSRGTLSKPVDQD